MAGGRLQPYLAAVALKYLLAHREADARPLVFVLRMQAGEYLKHLVLEFHINTDTIVLNLKEPVPLRSLCRHLDDRVFIRPELDGVADQILK